MPTAHGFAADRAALTRLLFPAGVPPLWSPTLVFYGEDGRIDRDRQLAHLAFMAPHVRGVLVPGSTGDAWEMDDTEALAALEDRLSRRRNYFVKGTDRGFDEDDDFWARASRSVSRRCSTRLRSTLISFSSVDMSWWRSSLFTDVMTYAAK